MKEIQSDVTPAPKRIQRRRTKGWRMPAGAIYVVRRPFDPARDMQPLEGL